MIQGQEIELSLGLPVEITSFNDRMPRACYPFTLKTLKRANIYLSSFNHEDLSENIKDEYKMIALMYFLKESFKEEDIGELMKHIDTDCFKELISDIKFVSGINDGKGDISTGSDDVLGWQKSINAIQTYTSNSYKDIQDMTFKQYSSLLSYVGTIINWEYKTNVISNVPEPKDFIGKDEHPLAPERKVEHKKIMTMKDIEGLKK